MKKYFLYLLPTIMLFASCDKRETTKHTQQEEDVSISINFRAPTRGGAFEAEINRVRVVMFRASDGKFVLNQYFDPISSGKVTFNTVTGIYDMYYIVNEPLTDGLPTTAYSGINLKSQISALTLSYATPSSTPYVPTDIPMFKVVSNQTISTSNTLSVSVERAMAKVLVDMIVDHSDFDAGEYVEISSVTIRNLPEYSYLVSEQYDGVTYTASETQIIAATSLSGVDTYNYEFYVPEYILAEGATRNAVIDINGTIKSSGFECKWTQLLGDKMDGNVAHTKYDIRRNTEYQFIGRVKSYGEDGLYVMAKIEDWTVTDVAEELN